MAAVLTRITCAQVRISSLLTEGKGSDATTKTSRCEGEHEDK